MNTLRIGVTGMSRAGKTVFLTSLIHHLVEGTAAALPELANRGIEYAGKAEPLPMKSHPADEGKSIGAAPCTT